MSATHWTLSFSWLQLLTNDDDDSMLPSFAITGTATVVAVFSYGLVFKIYITDEDCEVGRNDWHFLRFESIWRIHLAAVESVIMY